MNKNMRYKLREDKQDEFIKNYEYQSYKYANRDDYYYLKISHLTHPFPIFQLNIL